MRNPLTLNSQDLKDQLVELGFEIEIGAYRAGIIEQLLYGLIVEIESSRREIELISAEKDELLGIAAHDLRSPLTVILGAANLLQHQAADESRELVDMITRSSEKMLALLNNTLDVEKIESGRISLDLKRENLVTVLEESLKCCLPMIHEKNMEVHLEKRTESVPVVLDTARMEEVFSNLISNAVKYSHPGTRITISVDVSDDYARVSVKDQGIGIRQEELGMLFTKFARLSNKPTAGESSTGLGLVIVKKLVDLHNGKIEVSSVYGEGSTFTILLPVSEEAPDSIASEKVPQTISKLAADPHPPADPLKVLLIDDSAGARRVLCPMLAALGVNVVGEAWNGESGIALFRKLTPDLVFLDMVMPLMSGTEVLRHLKQINPECVVIMLTSIISREKVIESKEAGAFSYILKPFGTKEIERAINEVKFHLHRE